ncbi:MAG: hypothetical protein IKN20_07040, partial [Firmicutes bacterium]|nr:hypothetical protein [Bacillota bacterium]
MKYSFKKLLSTLLAFALLFGMFGSTAFAFDADNFVPELYELDGTEAEDEKTTPTPALTLSLSDSSLKIEIGDTAKLEAAAEGGKGDYEFDWSTEDRTIVSVDGDGKTATLTAEGEGEVVITCQVYDGEEAVKKTCKVTVPKAAEPEPEPEPEPAPEPEPEVKPLELELSRGTIDIGAGGTASLMASATGGSGMYEYSWKSSDSSVLSVEGDGSYAELYAARAGSVTVTCQVYDGEDSTTESCEVNVTQEGGSRTFDVDATATVGKDFGLDGIASQISAAFTQTFDGKPGYDAVLTMDNTNDWTGKVCMQGEGVIFPGSNYQFADMYAMMYFSPTSSGTFSTKYSVTDGVYTITGTLKIKVKEAEAQDLTVSISKNSISMDTYSTRTISVSVSPNNANYRVYWESNNENIVTADSSDNSVTLHSRGREGTTKVIATVTDRNTGKTYTKSCSVTVESDDGTTPSSKGGNYNPSITVTMASDYYGTSLSDSIFSEFHNRYNIWLTDKAKVTFGRLNTNYGRLVRASGFKVNEDVDYTFAELQDMTFEPYKAGTWTGTYSVTQNNKTLSGTMNIYVNGSSLTVNISHSSISLAPYSSQYVYATITPNSSYKISWSSDNTSVATVAGNGTTPSSKGGNYN